MSSPPPPHATTPTPAPGSARKPSTEPAFSVGMALFVACILLGGALGFVTAAAKSTDGTVEMVDYTTHASEGGSFNWLIFSLFLCTGIVSFAVCYAAAAINARR